jgi:GINS complex subunit 3
MGSYYDIDAILTDAQKLPCTFELDVPGLGFIDGNAGGDVGFDTDSTIATGHI